jgi:hypothetical protein
MEEMDQLSVGVPEFFDLKDPWLSSPKSGSLLLRGTSRKITLVRYPVLA